MNQQEAIDRLWAALHDALGVAAVLMGHSDIAIGENIEARIGEEYPGLLDETMRFVTATANKT